MALVNVGNIPQELKDLNQWVLWRWETRDGKPTKVPHMPGGQLADSTLRGTWSNLDAVLAALQHYKFDGIGLVVTDDDPYCGIDLDKCIDDQAHFADWATAIVDRFDSYTEVTPSGRGLRIWIRGRLPLMGHRKNVGDGHVELYNRQRYFTITGDHVPRCQDEIFDRQEELDKFHAELFPPVEKVPLEPQGGIATGTTPTMQDEEILTILRRAENNKKFTKLWNGDFSDYGSWSDADLALCMILAFYTRDNKQLDRLFRQSKLMRDKWDSGRSDTTYGCITVQKALESTKEHYSPPPKRNNVRMAEVMDNPFYELREDGIYYIQPKIKYTARGKPIDNTSETQVCNFSFEIVREVRMNDGDEVDTRFDITGYANQPFVLTATSDELADPRRMVARLLATAGGKAIVYRGGDAHLRPALQSMSNGYEREEFFVATGWYEIGEEWLFLTPGANLARMEIPHELKRYKIVKEPDKLQDGYKALQALMQVFPSRVSYISLAHAFLPPLYRWLNGTTRYLLHYVGETGSRKTTYAMALLCLYGDFGTMEPTEGWRSTVNKLQTIGWHAKDVLFLIDDFKPRYVQLKDFTQLVQDYGDNRARGRLNRDTTVKNSKPIRAVLVSTGEDIPEGEASVLARMIVLKIRNDEINLDSLSTAQQYAGSLPAVMADFLEWLPADLEINGKIEAWRDEYIACFTNTQTNPGRIALNMAQNRFAWQVLGDYLIARRVWTIEERQEYDANYLAASKEVIQEMGRQVTEEKAGTVFLDTIRAMQSAGRAEFLPEDTATQYENSSKVLLGWHYAASTTKSHGPGYYLLGKPVYHAVEAWLRQEGKSLGFSERAIWEQLVAEGKLIPASDGKTNTIVIKVAERTHRVYHLALEAIDDVETEEKPDELPF